LATVVEMVVVATIDTLSRVHHLYHPERNMILIGEHLVSSPSIGLVGRVSLFAERFADHFGGTGLTVRAMTALDWPTATA
jgi:hypothetical protein